MRTTPDQFNSLFKKAEAHFGVKNLNHDRYYEKIRNFEPSIVSEAINSIVDTAPPLLSKFPTPVSLLMACKDASGRRRDNNRPKAYGCDTEGCDSGFVMYYRFPDMRRHHTSNPCAHCFPSHLSPQVLVQDGMMFYAFRREGKKNKADFTDLRPIPNSQYLNEKQFVEYLETGKHRIPGGFVAVAKPKPNQVFQEQSEPAMVKPQAQEMLKNLVGEELNNAN